MGVWKLYYDGGCNLCHSSQLKAVQWAGRAGQPLETEFLQSAEALAKGYRDAMVLEADGQVLSASEAWLKLLTLAPAPTRWLAFLSLTSPTRALARFGYGIAARVRYRLFGTRSCPLPSKK